MNSNDRAMILREIDDLKASGQHEAAGRKAARYGFDAAYGCHFGMKSDRAAAMDAYARGYASAAAPANAQPARIAFLGHEFEVADYEFTVEKAADLSRLADDCASRNRSVLAAKAEAKSAYISLTLQFLDRWAEFGPTPTDPPADHTESPAYVAALSAFRAGCTIMTKAGFENEYGEDILEGIEGVDSVMVYAGGTWIANMGSAFNRTHYLILERDEYSTADGSYTLGELEALLYQWTLDEGARIDADAERAGKFDALPPVHEEEPHAAADAAVNAAMSRFSDTWDRIEAKHALARAFMAIRPDLSPLSLDEWLAEHHHRLTDKERTVGHAILALFY